MEISGSGNNFETIMPVKKKWPVKQNDGFSLDVTITELLPIFVVLKELFLEF